MNNNINLIIFLELLLVVFAGLVSVTYLLYKQANDKLSGNSPRTRIGVMLFFCIATYVAMFLLHVKVGSYFGELRKYRRESTIRSVEEVRTNMLCRLFNLKLNTDGNCLMLLKKVALTGSSYEVREVGKPFVLSIPRSTEGFETIILSTNDLIEIQPIGESKVFIRPYDHSRYVVE